MSRATIIVLVAAAVMMLAAVALWLGILQADGQVADEPTPARMSDDADRRQRAQKFLGGDPDHDVRGGQEMKPRW